LITLVKKGTRSMYSKRLIALGALIAVGTLVGPATATTYGSLGGSACHPVYPDTNSASTNLYHSEVGINSSDNASKILVCPIPRSNALSTTGLSGAYVDMKDATNGQDYCWLSANDEYGNQVATSGVKYSGGSGNREIAFGSIATSDAWGFYSIFCGWAPPTLPNPNNVTWIYSYQWAER